MEKIADYVTFLTGKKPDKSTIAWPPDAFAIAASLLDRSGAYLDIVQKWPRKPGKQSWAETIRLIGEDWRDGAAGRRMRVPTEIESAWGIVLRHGHRAVEKLRGESRTAISLRGALMNILAAADEACVGVGIPLPEDSDFADAFHIKTLEMLAEKKSRRQPTTLCRKITPAKLSVLPKMHTPQSGITIRSFSHHLALLQVPEVCCEWTGIDPYNYKDYKESYSLNILVAPWPLLIEPSYFSPANPVTGGLTEMDGERHGFFHYKVRGGSKFPHKLLQALIETATAKVGDVDMIVFPELSLVKEDIGHIAAVIGKCDPQPIFIGGLCLESDENGGACENTCLSIIPLAADGSAYAPLQHKHHRWVLDGSQVRQYGLGSILDPTMRWWEHSMLPQRRLHFTCTQTWLTFCPLVCEDLARPDPIGNIIRAVGPNLVIALLMDGPQLASRWPGRYGTVLADDPGSSVLTVSPLGMVKLSRPPGRPPSSVIALWKDAISGGPVEIDLPNDHHGVLLCLSREWRSEFTADGRGDENSTGYLTLSGIHPIKVDKANELME
ncbi:MAG: hypothetical protein ACREKL_03815 [Chthoniobacterales bacterium]